MNFSETLGVVYRGFYLKKRKMKIKISKEFTFEMAHSLRNYVGACGNIHGHSYKLIVTVIGEPLQSMEDPKDGMVMDFSELKRIVKEQVIDKYDHALLLNYSDTNKAGERGKLILAYQNPTAENMVANFVEDISENLPFGITLHTLRLYETATSYAEYCRLDQ